MILSQRPAMYACLVVCWSTSLAVAQEELTGSGWPQFRGPQFNPVIENDQLPDTWSTNENIEWSVDIEGRGWSSPIITGGKIFLTSVTTDGQSKEPQTGTDYSNEYVAELTRQGLSEEEVERKVMERDFELPDQVFLHYFLLCLDLESGQTLWKQEFYAGHPPGGRHRKNSFTSETPVTDGKFVYVYVTNLGLFAYDLSGSQVWHTPLDKHRIYMEFGSGSSPALLDDKLIIVNDNEEHSTISAYDTATGELVWQTARQVPQGYPEQMPKSGWATPFIWKHDLRTEIVTSSPGVAISYSTDGKELWRVTGVTPAPSASSFAYDGLLYLNGGKTKPIFAIRPGAHGDITPQPGQEKGEFVAWVQARTGTYIPTPVAYQGGIYIVHDNGIVVRLDAKTGEESFKARLRSPDGADFSASPWAFNGLVFCVSEQGDTYVIQAAPEYKLVRVNRLNDLIMSSPAVVQERLILRTAHRIYSIRQGS